MDQILKLLPLVTAGLAVIGAVIGLTRYLTKVQDQAAQDKQEADNRDLRTRIDTLEQRRDQLLEQISIAGRAGGAALQQKAELDGRLQSLMGATGASGGSIYLPVRSPRGELLGLAFLCIEPFNVQTQTLRSKVIPLKSIAGRCLVQGEAFVVANAAQSKDHFKSADAIAHYKPSTMMNLALKDKGEVVGVLQLLSKEGETAFADADLARVAALTGPIAEQVGLLARNTDCLKLLGMSDETAPTEGTILYFDLSGSSLLFQELSAAFALQLLNEYFERLCDVAFKLGATLDCYLGDGALLRFNVPRPLPEHQFAAVSAAIEMSRAFADLKDYWIAISPRFAALQLRIGISSGPLLRASLGHSQIQSLTVIGYPISVAAALCEAGTRERTSLLVSAESYEAVRDRVIAVPLSPPLPGKAATFTSGIWEISGLR